MAAALVVEGGIVERHGLRDFQPGAVKPRVELAHEREQVAAAAGGQALEIYADACELPLLH